MTSTPTVIPRTELPVGIFVRVRPTTESETASQNLKYSHHHVTGELHDYFNFDFGDGHVLTPEATNTETYELVAQPIIRNFLAGCHGYIFSYGHIATGKTYSMFGNEDDPGLIPLTLAEIFSRIKDEFCTVFYSYFEIYQERVLDLLSADNETDYEVVINERGDVPLLSLVHHLGRKGTKQITLNFASSAADVLVHVRRGQVNQEARIEQETAVTRGDHRSHRVLRLLLGSRKGKKQSLAVSELYLVDLAGPENIERVGATGFGVDEQGAINQSLLALEKVLKKASKGGPKAQLLTRDSKLTRILQPAIHGDAMVGMLCCVSPAQQDIPDTYNTLQFAHALSAWKCRPSFGPASRDSSMFFGDLCKKAIDSLMVETRTVEGLPKGAERQRRLVHLSELLGLLHGMIKPGVRTLMNETQTDGWETETLGIQTEIEETNYDKLMNDLSTAKAQLSHRITDNHTLKKRIEELEKEQSLRVGELLNDLSSAMSEKETEVEWKRRLSDERAMMQDEVDRSRSMIANLESAILTAEVEKARIQEELDLAQTAFAQQSTRVRSEKLNLRKTEVQLQQQIALLQHQLDEQRTEAELELKRMADRLEESLKAAKHEAHSAIQSQQRTQRGYESVASEAGDLRAVLKEAQDYEATLKNEIATLQAKLLAVTAEKDKLSDSAAAHKEKEKADAHQISDLSNRLKQLERLNTQSRVDNESTKTMWEEERLVMQESLSQKREEVDVASKKLQEVLLQSEEYKRQVEKTENELKSAQETIHHYEERMDKLSSGNASLSSETYDLRSNLQQLRDRIKTLDSDLLASKHREDSAKLAHSEEVTTLRDQLSQEKKSLTESEFVVQGLQQSVAKLESSLRMTGEREKELLSEKDKLSLELQSTLSQLSTAQQSHRTVLEELSQARQQISSLMIEMKDLTIREAQLVQDCSVLREAASVAASELSATKSTVSQLETKASTLSIEVSSVTGREAQLAQELAVAREQIVKISAASSESQNDLQARIELLNTDLLAARAAEVQWDERCKTLTAQVADLTDSESKLKATISSLSEDLALSAANEKSLSAKMTTLSAQFVSVSDSEQKLTTAVATLEFDLAFSRSQEKKLKDDFSALSAELHTVSESELSHKQRVDTLTADLAFVTESDAKSKQQMQSLSEDLSLTLERESKLKSQLDTFKLDLQSTTDSELHLQTQLQQRTAEWTEKEAKYRADYEIAMADLAQSNDVVSSMKDEFSLLQSILSSAQSDLASSQSQEVTLEQELIKIHAALDKASADLSAANEHERTLESDLTTSLSKETTLRAEFVDLQEVSEKTSAELSAVKIALAGCQSLLSASAERETALQTELVNLREQLDKITGELSLSRMDSTTYQSELTKTKVELADALAKSVEVGGELVLVLGRESSLREELTATASRVVDLDASLKDIHSQHSVVKASLVAAEVACNDQLVRVGTLENELQKERQNVSQLEFRLMEQQTMSEAALSALKEHVETERDQISASRRTSFVSSVFPVDSSTDLFVAMEAGSSHLRIPRQMNTVSQQTTPKTHEKQLADKDERITHLKTEVTAIVESYQRDVSALMVSREQELQRVATSEKALEQATANLSEHAEKLAKTESALTALRLEYDALKEQSESSSSNLTHNSEKLRSELAALQAKLAALEEEHHVLAEKSASEVALLKSLLRESEVRYGSSQATCGQQAEQITASAERILTLTAEFESEVATRKELEAQLSELRKSHTASEQEVASLKRQLSDSESACARLTAQIETLSSDAGSSTDRLSAALADIVTLNQSLKDAVSMNSALETELDKERASRLREHEVAKSALDAVRGASTKVEDVLSQENISMKEQITTLMKDVSALSAKLAASEQQVSDCEKSLVAAQETADSQAASVADLRSQVEAAARREQDLQWWLLAEKQKVEDLTKQVSEASLSLNAKDEELTSLRQSLSSTASELSQSREQLRTQLSETENKLWSTEQAVSRLELELASAKEVSTQLAERLSATQSDLAVSVKSVEFLQKSLDEVKEQHEEIITEKQSVSELLATRSSEHMMVSEAKSVLQEKFEALKMTASVSEAASQLQISCLKDQLADLQSLLESKDELLKEHEKEWSERYTTARTSISSLEKHLSEAMASLSASQEQREFWMRQVEADKIKISDLTETIAQRDSSLELQSQKLSATREDLVRTESELAAEESLARSLAAEADVLKNQIGALEATVKDIQQDLAAVSDERQRVSAALESTKESLAAAMTCNDTLTECQHTLEEQVSDLQKILDKERAAHVSTKTSQADLVSKMSQISTQSQSASQSTIRLQQEISHLEEQLTHANASIAEAETHREEYLKQMAQQQEEIKRLVSDVETQSAAATKVKRDLDNNMHELGVLQLKYYQAQEENSRVVKEFADQAIVTQEQIQKGAAMHQALEEEMKQSLAQAALVEAKLCAELENMEHVAQDWADKYAQLRDEYDALNSQHMMLESLHSEMLDLRKATAEELQRCEAERSRLDISIIELEASKKELSDTVSSQTVTVNLREAQLLEAATLREGLQAEIAEWSNKYRELDTKHQKLIEDFTLSSSLNATTLERMDEKINGLKSDKKSLEASLAALSGDKGSIEQQLSSTVQQLSEKSALLEAEVATSAELRAELAKSTASVTELSDAVSTHLVTIGLRDAQLVEAAAVRDTLQAEITGWSNKHRELDTKHQKLIEDFTLSSSLNATTLERMDEKINGLKTDKKDLEQKLALTTQELNEKTTLLATEQETATKLHEDLVVFSAKAEQLEAAVAEQVVTINLREAQLTDAAVVKETLQAEITGWSTKHRELDTKHQKLIEDFTLSSSLNATTLERMDEKINGLKTEKKELELKLSSTSETLVQKETELATVSTDFQMTQQFLTEKETLLVTEQKTNSSLSAEIAAKSETIAELHAQIDMLLAQTAQMQERIAVLTTEKDDLTKSLADKEKAVARQAMGVESLQQLIAEQEQELTDVTNTILDLQKQSVVTAQQIADSQLQLAAVKGERSDLVHNLATTEEQLKATKDALDECISANRAMEAEIRALEENRTMSEAEFDNLRVELQERIVSLELVEEKSRAEIDVLRAALEQAEGDVRLAQHQWQEATLLNKQMQESHANFTDDASQLADQLNAANDAKASLQQDVLDLKKALEIANGQISHAHAAIAELESRNSSLQESVIDLETVRHIRTELTAALERASAEIEILNIERSRLMQESTALHSQLMAQESALVQIQSDGSVLNGQLAAKEDLIATLRSEIDQTVNAADAMKAQHEQLLSSVRADVNLMHASAAKQQDALVDLRRSLEAKEAEAESLANQIHHLETGRIATLEMDYATISIERDTLVQQVEMLRRSAEEVQTGEAAKSTHWAGQSSHWQQEAEHRGAQLRLAQSERDRLQSDLKQLSAQFDSEVKRMQTGTTREFEALFAEHSALQQQVSQLLMEVEAQQQTISIQRTDLKDYMDTKEAHAELVAYVQDLQRKMDEKSAAERSLAEVNESKIMPLSTSLLDTSQIEARELLKAQLEKAEADFERLMASSPFGRSPSRSSHVSRSPQPPATVKRDAFTSRRMVDDSTTMTPKAFGAVRIAASPSPMGPSVMSQLQSLQTTFQSERTYVVVNRSTAASTDDAEALFMAKRESLADALYRKKTLFSVMKRWSTSTRHNQLVAQFRARKADRVRKLVFVCWRAMMRSRKRIRSLHQSMGQLRSRILARHLLYAWRRTIVEQKYAVQSVKFCLERGRMRNLRSAFALWRKKALAVQRNRSLLHVSRGFRPNASSTNLSISSSRPSASEVGSMKENDDSFMALVPEKDDLINTSSLSALRFSSLAPAPVQPTSSRILSDEHVRSPLTEQQPSARWTVQVESTSSTAVTSSYRPSSSDYSALRPQRQQPR